ncbi:MAG: hypothetical protein COA90_11060 [Gammaproteobacteria bacterium]|nr:MAG: hypothetical protein COA90_11060 [Gammaproteobacteria bacterium]
MVIIAVFAGFLIQWWISCTDNEEFQALKSKSAQLEQVAQDKQQQAQIFEQENNSLQTHLIQQRSEIAIQQATIEQLQLNLAELQQSQLLQDKDLLFYQSITQGQTSSKLQIKELKLYQDTEASDLIRYRLVITQGKKINKPIQGSIRMVLSIDNNGTIEQQKLESHDLNLRHVRVLEGQIKLNENALPISIKVTLVQNKKTTLTREFKWQLSPK